MARVKRQPVYRASHGRVFRRGAVLAGKLGGGIARRAAASVAKMAVRQVARRMRGQRRVQSNTSMRQVVRGRWGKSFGGVSTGFYRGKFRKPVKRVGWSTAQQTKYLSAGYLANSEVFGRVADADCVYIGHSTFDRTQVARAVAAATLRKLLKKCGFDPDQPQQEIPIRDYGDSRGAQLRWARIESTGLPVIVTYTFVDGETLQSLIINSGMATQISDCMEMVDGSVRGSFDRVSLYTNDTANTGSTWSLAGELNLRDEVLDIFVQSTLTVQNRTKSGTVDTVAAETVDNQPLRGRLYDMIGGVPQTKEMGANGLNRVPANGILLQQSVDLSPAAYFKEPPMPKIFSNCYKSSNITLEPGMIRKTVLTSQWRGYFNHLVCHRLTVRQVPFLGQMNYAPGKCQLIALEERLNSGSTNPITVSYEADRKFAAMLITSRRPCMLGHYEDAQVDNV